MGRDLERTHQADRRRLALAVACRCRLLLPSRILPFVFPVQYVDVRPRLLAELPLLPRPRHVGYRGLHVSNATADGAAVCLCPARIPGPAPCGRRAERRAPRVPRPPVSLGERTPPAGSASPTASICRSMRPEGSFAITTAIRRRNAARLRRRRRRWPASSRWITP